ncbi:MAG TPA: hypothetical protein VN883_06350 [Myxococcales bacterium]|jgi:hypothetical protein|nr:hypothetical protein [Myxococcales bacterium]
MQMIRDWGFPIGLIAAWMLAAAYTLSVAMQGLQPNAPVRVPQPAAIEQSGS